MSLTSSDARCTDRVIGKNFTAEDAAEAQRNNPFVCNIFLSKEKCVKQINCAWKENGDTCACTFEGCSCDSPVATSNSDFPALTMVLVVAPTCSLVVCVTLSLIGYFFRERISKILVKICPAKIMKKLEVKDNMDAVEEAPKVTTAVPSDSDEEEGSDHKRSGAVLDGQPAKTQEKKKKKKKKVDKKQEAADYRGDWMLTIVVERAQNLPRLDASLRDPCLIGNAGAPPSTRARRRSAPRDARALRRRHPAPRVPPAHAAGGPARA
jgi:hypothetical protein